MKIAVKEVGKEIRLVEVSDQYRDNCVKVFTGKKDRAQYIGLNSNGTLCIGVNEAGLLYNMPLNFYIATTSKHFPIQKIVGTAVFVRTKYANPWVQDIYDFEVEDLTEEDVKLIKNILGETHQKQLMENFEDYGNGYVVIEKL